jgi:hypothetical protein
MTANDSQWQCRMIVSPWARMLCHSASVNLQCRMIWVGMMIIMSTVPVQYVYGEESDLIFV